MALKLIGRRCGAVVLGLAGVLSASAGFGASTEAPVCPSAQLCRETAPKGALLHNPNSNGHKVWTVSCKGPDAPKQWSNTSPKRLDQRCRQISSCPAAGGFGKFLQAVTFNCERKQFDTYFGLDGMTFGTLDWTSDNLPALLQAFRARGEERFQQVFGELKLPMSKSGCLDPKWVCESNRNGKLTCDAPFHDAFDAAIKTPEFQKAQVDYALKQYERRLRRFASLQLKTEYGNTAMAVLANNLRNADVCTPESWKQACSAEADETKLVDCMLEQYAKNSCRGSEDGSRERVAAIKKVFAGTKPSTNVHPKADDVIACSDAWGTTGTR